MRRTYRRHKLKITDATLRAFKRARIRELQRRGRPVPTTLLPSEATPKPRGQHGQQPLPFPEAAR